MNKDYNEEEEKDFLACCRYKVKKKLFELCDNSNGFEILKFVFRQNFWKIFQKNLFIEKNATVVDLETILCIFKLHES